MMLTKLCRMNVGWVMRVLCHAGCYFLKVVQAILVLGAVILDSYDRLKTHLLSAGW